MMVWLRVRITADKTMAAGREVIKERGVRVEETMGAEKWLALVGKGFVWRGTEVSG